MKHIVIIAVAVGINSAILQATSQGDRLPRVIVNLEHDDDEETSERYPLWLEKTFYGAVLVVGGYLSWRVIKKLDIQVGSWQLARVERKSLAKRTAIDLQGATFPLFKVQKQGGKPHYLLATSSDLAINIDDLPENSSIHNIAQQVDAFVTSRVTSPWLGQKWQNYVVGKNRSAFNLERNNGLSIDQAMEGYKVDDVVEMKVIRGELKKIREAPDKDNNLTRELETILEVEVINLDEIEKGIKKIEKAAERALALTGDDREKLTNVLIDIKDSPDGLVDKVVKAKEEGRKLFDQLADGPFRGLDRSSVGRVRPSDVIDYLRREAFVEEFNFELSTVLMEEQLTRLGRKMGKEIVELSPIKEIWEAERLAIEEKNLMKKSRSIINLIENANRKHGGKIIDYTTVQLRDAQQAYLTGDIDKTIDHLNLGLGIKRSLARHEQINLSWFGKESEYLFNELRRRDIAAGLTKTKADKLHLGKLKLDERRVQSIFSDNVLLFIKENDPSDSHRFLDDIFGESAVTEAKDLIDATLAEIAEADARTKFSQKIALLEKLVQRYPDKDTLIREKILTESLSSSLEDLGDIDTIVMKYWQRLTTIVDDAGRSWKNHDRSALIDCLNSRQKSCFIYLDIRHFSFPNVERSKTGKLAKHTERHWYEAKKHSLLELLEKEGFQVTPER